MPANYTDLFNTALDDLAAFLTEVTGLQVVLHHKTSCHHAP